MKESMKKAQAEYNKKCKLFQLRINREKEADIIKWLEDQENPSGKIKELIRKEM